MNGQPKTVRYTNRDFRSLTEALEQFTRVYYPDSAQDFSEESIGRIWMEQAAYVGDVLSFYTDRQYQESFIQLADDRQNVIQLAQERGYVPKLSRPALTTVEIGFGAVPVEVDPQTGELQPDLSVVPRVEEGMVIGSSSSPGVQFRTTRAVDFSVDTDADPLRVSIATTNANTGEPEEYVIAKRVPATAGRLVTETFSFDEPEPYAERVIRDADFVGIVNVTDSDNNTWYEVPYLAQETVFEEIPNTRLTDPNLAQDQSARYLIRLRRTSRRFTTRLDRRENVVMRFGGGVSDRPDEKIVPNPRNVGNPTLKAIDQLTEPLDPSNFLITDTYGEVPYDTELTVSYISGGGVESNVPTDDLTNVRSVQFDLSQSNATTPSDQQLIQDVQQSLFTRNVEPATGGRGAESVTEIRENATAYFSAQDRAVTSGDYVVRTLNMPPRYGSVSKAYATNDEIASRSAFLDNPLAINLYTLGLDSNGNLTPLSDAVKQNLKTYLERFRMQTDAVNIKDGFVINIAVDFDVLVFSGYNRREVLLRCIGTLRDMLSIDNMQFNQPLIVGEYVQALSRIEGVQNVGRIDFTAKFGGEYSDNVYDVQSATLDGIVYPSKDPSVFELRFPERDITGNAK